MTGETKQLKDDVVHQAIKDAESNQPEEYDDRDNSNFINPSTKQPRGMIRLYFYLYPEIKFIRDEYVKLTYGFLIVASSPAEGLRLKVPSLRSRSSSPVNLEKTPIPWLNKCKFRIENFTHDLTYSYKTF